MQELFKGRIQIEFPGEILFWKFEEILIWKFDLNSLSPNVEEGAAVCKSEAM